MEASMRRTDLTQPLAGLAVLFLVALFSVSCVSAAPESGDEDVDAEAYQEEEMDAVAPSVAILDFDVKSNISGYDALATDVPNALAEAFVRSGALVPIERSSLLKILEEQELSLSGAVDSDAAAQIGRLAGARYVLLGSVTIIGEQARLSGRLVDVESAEIHWAGSATGDLDEIFDIEAELAYLAEEELAE